VEDFVSATTQDPTLIGDLALVAELRALAGTIDRYREIRTRSLATSGEQLLAWVDVQDASRAVAWALLFTPDEDPTDGAVEQLADTLIEQVRAHWEVPT
jgi:hypothetical protein